MISTWLSTQQNAGGTFDPAAVAYFAAMSAQPDNTRKTLINTLIVNLKSGGVWAKLDWLSLVASHDAQAARLNAVNPAQIMTVVSTPTFTTDRGYTGDGVGTYLNTSWNPTTAPSPKLIQDSAHIGGWMGTDVASTSQADFGGLNNRLNTHYDGTRFRAACNGADTLVAPGGTPTSIGHWTTNRSVAANFQTYKNGAAYSSLPVVSAAPANGPFLALAVNNASTGLVTPGQYSTRRLQALHWGGSLSVGEVTSFYTNLAAYMSAIGA